MAEKQQAGSEPEPEPKPEPADESRRGPGTAAQLREELAIRDAIADAGLVMVGEARTRFCRALLALSPADRQAEIEERKRLHEATTPSSYGVRSAGRTAPQGGKDAPPRLHDAKSFAEYCFAD